MSHTIESESKFIWRFILDLLISPWTLLMVLLKKKQPNVLFKPVKDIAEFITQPRFTFAMIVLNVTAFIVVLFLPESTINALVTYPKDLLSPTRWFSFITAGFLHANLAHIAGNMLALFIFGRVVERRMGPARTAIVYFIAMIAGSILQGVTMMISGSDIGGLGASGAIMGLISAAILLDPWYFTYELIVPLPVMIVGWLTMLADVTGIVSAAADGVGHFAHVGGYLGAMAIVFMFGGDLREKAKKGFWTNVISLAVLGGLIFLFGRQG